MATAGRSVLLLAWEVSAVQEEPWRRFLQELSYARGEKGYVDSRRRLGVSAESVWLIARPSGGGMAVVCLEAFDPERALGELSASEAPFDSWYGGAMRRLFGFDLSGVPRAGSSELLFAWRDDRAPGGRGDPKGP